MVCSALAVLVVTLPCALLLPLQVITEMATTGMDTLPAGTFLVMMQKALTSLAGIRTGA
jgi:hypothetical protein